MLYVTPLPHELHVIVWQEECLRNVFISIKTLIWCLVILACTFPTPINCGLNWVLYIKAQIIRLYGIFSGVTTSPSSPGNYHGIIQYAYSRPILSDIIAILWATIHSYDVRLQLVILRVARSLLLRLRMTTIRITTYDAFPVLTAVRISHKACRYLLCPLFGFYIVISISLWLFLLYCVCLICGR